MWLSGKSKLVESGDVEAVLTNFADEATATTSFSGKQPASTTSLYDERDSHDASRSIQFAQELARVQGCLALLGLVDVFVPENGFPRL